MAITVQERPDDISAAYLPIVYQFTSDRSPNSISNEVRNIVKITRADNYAQFGTNFFGNPTTGFDPAPDDVVLRPELFIFGIAKGDFVTIENTSNGLYVGQFRVKEINNYGDLILDTPLQESTLDFTIVTVTTGGTVSKLYKSFSVVLDLYINGNLQARIRKQYNNENRFKFNVSNEIQKFITKDLLDSGQSGVVKSINSSAPFYVKYAEEYLVPDVNGVLSIFLDDFTDDVDNLKVGVNSAIQYVDYRNSSIISTDQNLDAFVIYKVNFIDNGTFDDDASEWTLSAGVTYNSGNGTLDWSNAAAQTAQVSLNDNLQIGNQYVFAIQVKNYVSGSLVDVDLKNGATVIDTLSLSISADGQYLFMIDLTGASDVIDTIVINSSATVDFETDNIAISEVTQEKRFLTNAPNNIPIRSGESAQLSFVIENIHTETISTYFFRVRQYDSLGALIRSDDTTFALESTNMYHIGCGIENLSAIFDSDTSKYDITVFGEGDNSEEIAITETITYKVESECIDQSWRLHWLNSLGGIDSYTFIGKTSVSKDVTRNRYKRSLNVPRVIPERQLSTVDIESNIIYNINSGFINKQRSEWLSEILDSLDINIEVDQIYLPIDIEDNDTPISDSVDKLFNINIFFMFAFDRITQKN